MVTIDYQSLNVDHMIYCYTIVFLTIVAKHHDDRMVNMERKYWPLPCQYCVDKISRFQK